METSRWLSIFLIFWLFCLSTVHAQSWVEMMEDPTVNFYDIQQSFNQYWQGKSIERGKGWKQFKRWEYFMESRVYPTGRIPDPDQASKAFMNYMAAYDESLSFNDYSNWSSLGPNTWVTLSYNPGIGRINCTAVDPNNSQIICVGAPSGGFWKSTDTGNSWATTTDHLTVLGVTSIAINPSIPDHIYIATGDGDAGDTYSIGVLKSIDGGNIWNSTGLNWQVTQSRRISKLLIHPLDPNVLLAAASNGIYKSIDAGTNWTLIQPGNFKDMEFKPNDPSTIYACGTQFYVSTNTGSSFSLLSSGLPSSANVSRLAIAVTDANPNYVYLLAGNTVNYGFYGLYRSTDSGFSFSLRSNSPNLLGWSTDGSDSGGQSWYDLAIAASPLNAEEVYVGGVNIWKSLDGGLSWNLNAHWYYFEPSVPYVHADIHALDFHGNRLFAGTDGGIFVSDDGGNNWIDWSHGLATTQFYRIGGYPMNENLVYGGTQDNGTNRLDAGVWTHVLGADGMETAIDYTDPDIVYACIQYGGLRKSLNGGIDFFEIGNDINESSAWVMPYIMDPINPQVLYAGFQNVWKTTNGGNSWTKISALSGPQQSMAIAPSNPNYIYTASNTAIYRTIDGGLSWTNISSGLPTGNAAITYIAISDIDPDQVWVTFSGYSPGVKVFESTDGGNSWTNYSGTLPNLPVNCIVHESGNYEALYIGTDIGVYYRNDLLVDWQPFINGLPNVIVQELEIHYASRKLRAASYGRGLWESPLTPNPAVITHSPLGDTEDVSGPYTVTAEIFPGSSPLIADSIQVRFSTDSSFSYILQMMPTGMVNEYAAQIPSQGTNVTINYYIQLVDTAGLNISSPYAAPDSSYRFFVGPDTVPPLLVHTPISHVSLTDLPVLVIAEVTDNIGIDSVWVEYSINGTQQTAFGLSANANIYSGAFPFDSTMVSLGDVIQYQVNAQDNSLNMNQTISGPHEFDIKMILTLTQIVNLSIPNNNINGITDVLNLTGNGDLRIIDVDVMFKAIHPNFGDFIVKLASPQGPELTLADRPGYPANPLGNPGNDPDIILDDQATESIEDITFGGDEQVLGTFHPHPDLLSAFNDQDHRGNWTITVIDNKPGHTGTFAEWGLIVSLGPSTSINQNHHAGLPNKFFLHQNYPNPFNPTTTIRYDLKDNARVYLKIYNILGQEIRTLVNEEQTAGFHSVLWDGKNNAGVHVTSGLYFFKIVAREFSQTRKMLLLK